MYLINIIKRVNRQIFAVQGDTIRANLNMYIS